VHFLGTNVDVPFLLEEIRDRLPVVVLLSAKLPHRFPALQHLLAQMRQDPATREIPVVVGGDIVQTMEADLTQLGVIPNRDTDLRKAVDSIVQLSEQYAEHRARVSQAT
jgi:hypothetical protein